MTATNLATESPLPDRELAAELAAAVSGKVLVAEPMSRHTTLRLGGAADYLIMPRTIADIRRALALCRQAGVAVKCVGNGSNLLVADRGYRGAIIKLTPGFADIRFNTHGVVVGAGAKLAKVVEAAAVEGWSGLESTVGIPGTMGGAIVTNAGTDTGSVGDLVSEAVLLDENGAEVRWGEAELAYGYRRSALAGTKMVVLSARLALRPSTTAAVRAKIERLEVKRSSRQPLGCRTAGSTFKNPPGEMAAGKLLDRAGAKGKMIGGAMVSTKHANFIINLGNATAAEARALVAWMQELVLSVYGLWLEPEVEFVGEW